MRRLPIDRRIARSKFAAVPVWLRDKNPCDGNKIVLPPRRRTPHRDMGGATWRLPSDANVG
jgi:hypothetical protein